MKGLFGAGVYFAESVSKADEYVKGKHVDGAWDSKSGPKWLEVSSSSRCCSVEYAWATSSTVTNGDRQRAS